MENTSCKRENNIKEEFEAQSFLAKIKNKQALEFSGNLQSLQQHCLINCKLNAGLTNNENLEFKCSFPNCNAKFAQSSDLKRHFRIHTKEKPYVCQTCQRAFNTSSNLKQHQQIHLSKNNRKKYICKVCNKQYYYSSNLKKHIEIFHPKLEKKENIKMLENSLQSLPQNESLQFQPASPSLSSSIFIKHNDHIDLLINGLLYYYDGNTIYVHQLDSTLNNKFDQSECTPISELSHYSSLRELGNIYRSIEKTFNYKITYNQLMNQNNCNSFVCACKLRQEHSNCENCINNVIKANSVKQTNGLKGLCLCNETKQFTHKHSENCGHIPIMHAGHIDYIVNGYLHFPHQDHCDNHGKIEVFTEQDLINFQQNHQNGMPALN